MNYQSNQFIAMKHNYLRWLLGLFLVFGYSSASAQAGTDCANPDVISSLPYSADSLTTAGFGDDYSSSDACGSSYMNGDDYVFSFTPLLTQNINITLSNTNTWVGVFLTEGCPDDTAAVCVASNTSSSGNPSIGVAQVTGGVTYYITVSTYPSPQTTDFDIDITEVACAEPSGLMVSNITSSSVDVSWTSINAVATGTIEYGPAGFNQGSGTFLTAQVSPATISGLTQNTDYDVYVQDSCTGGSSNWVGPVSFKTACNAQAAPYMEGFEGGSLPLCWSQDQNDDRNWSFNSGGTSSSTTGPSGANQGNFYAYVETSGSSHNDIAILNAPVVDISGLSTPTLGFDYHMYGSTMGTFTVEAYDGTNWVPVFSDTGDQGNQWFNDVFVSLSGFPSLVQVRFILQVGPTGSTFYNDLAIDDIRFVELPACPNTPSGLTASNITASSVDLNWSPGDSNAVSWEIEYGPSGFTLGSGTTMSSASIGATVSGLNPNTDYDFYVTEECTAGNFSLSDGPVAVTTMASCPNPPSGLAVVNAQSNSMSLTWTPGDSNAVSWTIEYDSTGFTQGSGMTMSVSTIGATVTGLDPNTEYDFYITEECSAGNFSVDVGPLTGKTACATLPAPLIESFAGTSTPSCWLESGAESWRYSTGAGYAAGNAGDNTNGGGTNYAWIDGSSPNGPGRISTLTSPLVDVSGLTSPYMDFYFFSENSNDTSFNNLTVEFWDGAAWNLIMDYAGPSGGWAKVSTLLSGFNITGPVQVRFTIEEDGLPVPYYNDILIDDVRIMEEPLCAQPSSINTSNATLTSIDISWVAGASGSSFEIEYDTAGFVQGTGNMVVPTSNPFTIGGLNQGADYDAYIREICATGDTSIWVPFTFSSLIPGADCGAPNVINSLPFVQTGLDTDGAGDDFDNTTNPCGGSYMNGDDYVFAYIPQNDQIISITLTNTGSWVGVFLTEGCPSDTASVCVDFNTNSSGNPAISAASVQAGVTYFITVSTWPSPQTTPFDIEVKEVFCADPTNLSLSNITTTTMDVAWTSINGSAAGNIEYGPTGFTPGSGTLVSAQPNPATITGLSANTTYDVYVQDTCQNGASNWIGPVTATTACNAVPAPLSTNFSATSTPACYVESGSEAWRYSTGAGYAASSAGDHTPIGGTNYAWIDGSTPNGPGQISSLQTPFVDITGVTNGKVEFYYFSSNTNDSSYNTLTVEFNDGSAWTTLMVHKGESNGWAQFDTSLAALSTTGPVALRFTVEENGNPTPFYNDILIDDIYIGEPPACPNPPLGITASNVTANSAFVNWTPGDTNAVGWVIEYDSTGFAPGSGNTMSVTTVGATVTGLNPATTYDFYVTEECSAGNFSLQSGPVSATTACLAFAAPFSEGFEGGVLPNCWELPASNEMNWVVDANGTSSSSTGPSTGSNGSTYYIYTETSGTSDGDTAVLMLPQVDISSLAHPALKFDYHMYGVAMGTLSAQAFDGTNWVTIWSETGDKGDVWNTDEVVGLPLSQNPAMVRFHMEVDDANGSTFYNDAALDNIRIVSDSTTARVNVRLSLTTDNYGDETGYMLVDANGTVYDSVAAGTLADDSTYVRDYDVVEGAYLTFTITDAYGDGICCNYGNGEYVLTVCSDTVAMGGQFGFVDSANFYALCTQPCIDPVADFSSSNAPATMTGVDVTFTNTSNADAGSATYLWDFGDGNTSTQENPMHTFTANGTYTVSLVVTDQCGADTVTYSVIIQGISIAEEIETSINVFPNPASDMVNLEFTTGTSTDLNMQLVNVTGMVVWTDSRTAFAGTYRHKIDMDQLPKGVYLLQITTADGNVTRRISLQ